MKFLKMTAMVLKNLVGRPATLMYPVVKRKFFTQTRGHIEIEIETCIFCGICSKKCPTSAIEVSKDSKQWGIRKAHCIACGFCVDVCPKKCLYMRNNYSPSVFAVEKDQTEIFTQS